jgi:hypothetical protein
MKRLIKGLIIVFIAVLVFSSCKDSGGRNTKKVPEKISLNDQDAILESSTYLGFGYINIVLIRGHEYAIYSSRNDRIVNEAAWGTHLEETCIGCRGGSLKIDTITIDSHRYKITYTESEDGRCNAQAEHLGPHKYECETCYHNQ